jgi:uncharacterized membrane protein required for colicin V production
MVDVIVGLFIIVFLYFGFREGFAKTLGSIVMLFLALYAATAALAGLASTSAEFGNPKSLLTILTFFVIWLVLYVVLDLILKIVLKLLISIKILGPADQIIGLALGGIKGLLLAGIILQIILAFPLSSEVKKNILNAIPARFSIATFQYVYPEAKKLAPYLDKFIKSENKGTLMDELGTKTEEVSPEVEKLKNISGDKIMDRLEKTKKEQEKRLHQLLEDENPSPTAPQGAPR